MKFFRHEFDTKGIPILYWRICMKLSKQALILLLCCLLVRFTAQAESFGPTDQSNEQPPTPPVQHSPQSCSNSVAPIALYPDALVAQILAASTHPPRSSRRTAGCKVIPTSKVKSWQKKSTTVLGPKCKALAQFPSVLENNGQEPLLDFIPWRRIRQPAARCHGCRPGDASAGSQGRPPEQQ